MSITPGLAACGLLVEEVPRGPAFNRECGGGGGGGANSRPEEKGHKFLLVTTPSDDRGGGRGARGGAFACTGLYAVRRLGRERCTRCIVARTIRSHAASVHARVCVCVCVGRRLVLKKVVIKEPRFPHATAGMNDPAA
ncbi:hypothetical protein JYU34_007878 [Plutella xylostella]|uniref:Uncharacterized protein n=1 Tax=Plutella xylostella TaxID=51655 RepID=A0ABQ7QRH8_PLUXY|nr:hypothetical protein JYU34_007878 [Plutella xylostella]